MKTLFVNACVRPESRTLKLAKHVLAKLDGEVQEVNLEKENIQPLNLDTLMQRDALLKEKNYDAEMLKYAKQFAAADTVVIAAPFWDLSFPAMLKNYIEAVTVNGITFTYSEEGFPVSLNNIKKVIYVTTAGGPTTGMDYGCEYITGICQKLYGIPEVKCYKAEMLDVIGFDADEILAKVMEEIDLTM
ncbi:MAG: NAD(P)H-dependent oxidoreductase [Firmicutes bacterium]|nr:NAD(P)H-dependent oxidoreductase [Bacillota bacterium]